MIEEMIREFEENGFTEKLNEDGIRLYRIDREYGKGEDDMTFRRTVITVTPHNYEIEDVIHRFENDEYETEEITDVDLHVEVEKMSDLLSSDKTYYEMLDDNDFEECVNYLKQNNFIKERILFSELLLKVLNNPNENEELKEVVSGELHKYLLETYELYY